MSERQQLATFRASRSPCHPSGVGEPRDNFGARNVQGVALPLPHLKEKSA